MTLQIIYNFYVQLGHGNGKFKSYSGNSYDGQWKNDVVWGDGTAKTSDGIDFFKKN